MRLLHKTSQARKLYVLEEVMPGQTWSRGWEMTRWIWDVRCLKTASDMSGYLDLDLGAEM